jgi:type IV pilus assembly protein PilC
MREVIRKIISDVESGQAFSVALLAHPLVFNQIYVSLIAAGEASGTLDAALDRIALQQEKDAEIISKVRGALAYPGIVMIVMALVVGFMITTVLPQVEEIYKGTPGVKLPILTQVLLVISKFIINYSWLVIIMLIVAVIMTSRWAKTVAGARLVDTLKLRMPPLNRLFMKVYMARFSRTSATLIASGVPLIQMLEITSSAVSNVLIADSIDKAAEQVKSGKSLSSCLEGDPNFLPLVPNMLKIGEQSGQMQGMLNKSAEYYEKEVDNEIKTISTIIEPLMMVMLGGAAIIIVAAILMPIYALVGKSIIR